MEYLNGQQMLIRIVMNLIVSSQNGVATLSITDAIMSGTVPMDVTSYIATCVRSQLFTVMVEAIFV